jgi:hypothetical protein
MAYTDPRTWTNDELVDEDHFNEQIRDNLNAAFPTLTAYDDWTPTYTNLTVGSGAATVARYMQIGNIVFCRWQVTLGTSFSIGDVRVTLPVTSASTGYETLLSVLGDAGFGDTGTANVRGLVLYGGTTECAVRYRSSGNNTPLSSTVPFTWVSGDKIGADWHYEAA